ncbi:hypothetical protein O7635_26250 [Asanoa sp. WMMD1127]|uniref:hypothetical protein n=1 Tax=Asanoa sp. WMMD1127 TaxID=3016107 RepID=UPI002417741D|nr:hypothetical protein [Asanoa sp. WMMD1127]MDG4825363.1 hypothetical protein [Asanoa sp. WMMD1127]
MPGIRRGTPMDPTHRNALIVIAVACVIGPLFNASFTLALDRPTPRDVPAGIVVTTATERAAAELQARTRGGFAFRPYGTAAAVEEALRDQDIYAALVPFGAEARLLVASAAGSSVARVFERAAAGIPVVDVRPLPAGDSAGLLPFYLTVAATVTGFVSMLQLRAHAATLSLRRWLLCMVGLAVVAGGVMTVVTGPLISAQAGPFPAVWATVAGMIMVAALWAATMQILTGPWTFVPTFLFLMVLGLPSSGGAVAPPLLPGFFRILAELLPAGAAVDTLRNLLYYRDAPHAGPIFVLAAWLLFLLGSLLVAARLRGRTPGGDPFPPPRA